MIRRRDFTGSNGLVSFVTEPASREGVAALLDGMRLFGLGASWGGYESLIIPFDPRPVRTASRWPYEDPCFRLHCGLEDVNDLIEDLDAGLKRVQARG